MAHWTDDLAAADGGAADDLVRPYTITRGRIVPERTDLTLITHITTVDRNVEDDVRRGRAQPEHRLILNRCRRSAAVAEVASDLDLPVSVTKILIGDLLATGRVTARAPLAAAEGGRSPDVRLLQAVRDGLRKL